MLVTGTVESPAYPASYRPAIGAMIDFVGMMPFAANPNSQASLGSGVRVRAEGSFGRNISAFVHYSAAFASIGGRLPGRMIGPGLVSGIHMFGVGVSINIPRYLEVVPRFAILPRLTFHAIVGGAYFFGASADVRLAYAILRNLHVVADVSAGLGLAVTDYASGVLMLSAGGGAQWVF